MENVNTLPIFRLGFRPFFLLCAASAIVFPTLWVMHLSGLHLYYGTLMSPTSWHAHEMIYGFAQALIAGFLLTASANWTGKRPYDGKWLMGLVALWLIEHIALASPLPSIVSAALAVPFQLMFTVMLLRTLRNNSRNLYTVGSWSVFYLLVKLAWLYASYTENSELRVMATEMSVAAIRLLIVLISSRVLPFFTRKRFPQVTLQAPGYLSPIIFISLGALCLPLENLAPTVATALYIAAFVACLARMLYWKPLATASEPMLAILNLGNAWLVLHLAMKAFSPWISSLNFFSAATHAFTLGALGSFAIGMITRVSLGHTGRPIKVDKTIIGMFALVTFGAIARVITPILAPQMAMPSTNIAGALWAMGFLLFIFKFAPILTTPRN